MKIKNLFLPILLCFSAITFAQAPLNVMTFNIRYNNPGDSLNAWPFRKDNAALQIRFYDAQVVGVQEALNGQLEDLLVRLPGYAFVGVGRGDGKKEGEYSAILYQTERLEVIESATFWLSQTPTVPGSKGWDSDFPRVVTWAKFRDKENGHVFFDFNTHFDHIGVVARRESAKMLLRAVDSIAVGTTAIITGDFNAKPSDEPIKIITDPQNRLHLNDTKAISKLPHYGPTGTFTGFGPKEISDEPIDHIFFKGNIEVLKHATISESWQGRFSSDHFPVLCSVIIH